MRQTTLSSAFAALAVASRALGQSTTSSNPLNDFIGGVGSAVGIIQSASATEAAAAATTRSSSASSSPTSASSSTPSSSQASPTSSPTSAPAAAHHGSNHKTLIIAIVCAVVGALLLALILLGICCCLIRRRRKARKARAVTPVADDEINSWKSEKPQNPGRTYNPSKYGRVPSNEHEPMIPPMATGGRGPTGPTTIDTHPAYRPENPFVPVPPSPRRSAPNARAGLTDGTAVGDMPFVGAIGDPEKQRLRDHSRSPSRSRSATGSGNNGLPTHATAERPSTPFGLMGIGKPYAEHGPRYNGVGQPYGGIGQPYEDMHVHVLQNDAPSQALRQSLNNHDPLASAQPRSTTPGYSTPPDVPNRSPRRSGQLTESPYTTASDTGSSSTASEEYRASYGPAITIPQNSKQPYGPSSPYSHRLNYDPPLQQLPQQYTSQPYHTPQASNSTNTNSDRYSTSPSAMQPPPVPWGEPTEQRRQSPTRNSAQWAESGRRTSRSPATSINGQPRRLRFSDIQATPTGYGGWDDRYGTTSQASGGGVGEAM